MTSSRDGGEKNRQAFDAEEVVADYLRLDGLQPVERYLFSSYISDGSAILDLGVGTGRTVPSLSASASRYVAIDYADRMVAAARLRFPGLDIRTGDARDLSAFDDGSFDIVVFSFNGLDYIHPASERARCLREVSRVLRPGGRFIFSTHNSRGVLRLPREPSDIKAWAVAAYATVRAGARAIPSPAFWRGRGYIEDPVRGGLTTYSSTVRWIDAELRTAGLGLIDWRSSEFPTFKATALTRWWYCVAQKP